MLAASGVAQALGGSMILPDVTTDLNKRKMRTSQRELMLDSVPEGLSSESQSSVGETGKISSAQDTQAVLAVATVIRAQICPCLSAKPQCRLKKVRAEAVGQRDRMMQKCRAYRKVEECGEEESIKANSLFPFPREVRMS